MSTDEQDNIIRLTEEGFDSMLEALENPPPVSDKLKAAAKKFKEEGFCYSIEEVVDATLKDLSEARMKYEWATGTNEDNT